MADQLETLQRLLTGMTEDAKDPGVPRALCFNAWEAPEHKGVEFMIDLMDTLAFQPS